MASGLTVLLGCSVIVEVALWNVAFSPVWQLITAAGAGVAALGLHDGRRASLLATLAVLAASPVAAVVAGRELGMAASAPYSLAPAILVLLVAGPSLRWFRRNGRQVQVASHAQRRLRVPAPVAVR